MIRILSCLIILQDEERMPPPEEIVVRVLAAHHIREEDGKPVDITMLVKWKGDLKTFQGVAYLEPKNARTFFS